MSVRTLLSGRRLRWVRRGCLVGVLLAVALVVAYPFLLGWVAGASSRAPGALESELGDEARRLLAQAWDGIDPDRLVDYHTHLIGLGTSASGAYVSPEMRSWLHLTKKIRFEVYRDAAGIDDLDNADLSYVGRLAALVRHTPRHGRHLLLAFDKHYTEAGEPDPERTEFFTPNDYAFRVARQHPDLFLAAGSVHPYRPDALAELERCAARGVRIVKWLPNAMGMDPAHDRCVPFYRKMRELDLVLLCHAGEEQAVDAAEAQELGNPLRLRRALDEGVKVIVAHCASLGEGVDLDDPDGARLPNFDLFLRLMREERYRGLVFGEISAVAQFNRVPEPLTRLLEETSIHDRLVNGSDYPLPAINILVRTRALVKAGLLTEEERAALNEIYDFNPLLFDFVLKRTLKAPGTGRGFPASAFMAHPDLWPESGR